MAVDEPLQDAARGDGRRELLGVDARIDPAGGLGVVATGRGVGHGDEQEIAPSYDRPYDSTANQTTSGATRRVGGSTRRGRHSAGSGRTSTSWSRRKTTHHVGTAGSARSTRPAGGVLDLAGNASMSPHMASKQNHLDALREVPLFSACTNKELEKIAKASDEVSMPAGSLIVDQGQTGREAFVVLEGTVTVKRNGKKSRPLGPGAIVGELSLLDHGPRTATVTCETDCPLLLITAPLPRCGRRRAGAVAQAARLAGDAHPRSGPRSTSADTRAARVVSGTSRMSRRGRHELRVEHDETTAASRRRRRSASSPIRWSSPSVSSWACSPRVGRHAADHRLGQRERRRTARCSAASRAR